MCFPFNEHVTTATQIYDMVMFLVYEAKNTIIIKTTYPNTRNLGAINVKKQMTPRGLLRPIFGVKDFEIEPHISTGTN